MSDTNPANAVSRCNVIKQLGPGDHLVTATGRLSLEIADNEFFTHLGPSGCGRMGPLSNGPFC